MATTGFPIASVSNTVSGVPSQSDGNTTRSNADSVRATSRRKPAKTKRSPSPSADGLRLQVAKQRALPHEKESRRGAFANHARGGIDQVRVAFRFVKARDRADREVAGGDAKLAPGVRDLLGGPFAAELLERHAQVHDLHLRRRDLPRPDDEVRRALRDGQRDVGRRLEAPVGDLLIPRRVGEVGVLVHDGRNPPQRPDQAAERRRAVAVEVQDVDLLGVDDAEQRRKRARIELRSLEIRDVDAQRVERLFREVLFPQADQRDAEAVAIEPRNHPAEQALDAVHPRPFPAEVVADLENVQRSVHSRAVSGRLELSLK